MPSNVEIKAKVEDFVKVVRKAKELSASEGYYCCGICHISEMPLLNTCGRTSCLWKISETAFPGHRWAGKRSFIAPTWTVNSLLAPLYTHFYLCDHYITVIYLLLPATKKGLHTVWRIWNCVFVGEVIEQRDVFFIVPHGRLKVIQSSSCKDHIEYKNK